MEVTRKKHRRLWAIVGLAFLGLGACNKSPASDAGAESPVASFHSDEFGFELAVPGSWRAEPPDASTGEEQPEENSGAKKGLVLFGVRRRPISGHNFLVAPRLVIRVDPLTKGKGVSALVREATDTLRRLESSGLIKIRRTSDSRRPVDGIEVADLEIDYTVSNPGSGAGHDVVQRSLIAERVDRHNKPHGLSVTLTYMANDDEILGNEVDRMLRTLHFDVSERVDAAVP